MNISELKAVIGLGSLLMVRQTEQDDAKTPTDWLSHWDNDKRIRVTMHQDVLAKIKAEPNFNGLALKPKELVSPEGKAPYTRYIVIIPANVEAAL